MNFLIVIIGIKICKEDVKLDISSSPLVSYNMPEGISVTQESGVANLYYIDSKYISLNSTWSHICDAKCSVHLIKLSYVEYDCLLQFHMIILCLDLI